MTTELQINSKPFREHQGQDMVTKALDMVGLKEWAFAQGYCIEAYRVPKEKNQRKCKYFLQLTLNYKNKSLFNCFDHTEYDAVVRACEYILERRHYDVGRMS